MKATLGNLARRQRGQTLILFTLLFTVLIGFLALAIDLGFLFGQRRWDQDGSDAAAMAVAHSIAESVVPLNNSGMFIADTDCGVYALARQYAGLSTIDGSSCVSALPSAPSGVNQNSGLDPGNKVAVVVEYCNGSTTCDPGTVSNWCFSPASITSLPTGTLSGTNLPRTGESQCQLYVNNNIKYPPLPGSNPYKIRISVSTVTTSSFAQMLVPNGNLGPPISPSAPQSDPKGPACVRPGGANGMLACASAISTISGVVDAESLAPLVPFVANDCNIGGGPNLTQLWTNNPPANCSGENTNGSWKGTVDLTWETAWCSHYSYQTALPHTNTNPAQPYSSYSGSATYPCNNNPVPDAGVVNGVSGHQWYRAGYAPDQTNVAPLQASSGADDPVNDVQFWASQGFGGSIHASYTDGNFMPTYCDVQSGPGCGNHGNNIAQAFYCQAGNITNSGDGCIISGNNQVTYFFQWNKLKFGGACATPGNTTAPNTIGCREAGVPTWEHPQTWQCNGQGNNCGWKSNGTPDRVQIVRILQMRLYCQISTQTGYCTDPPTAIINNASNSEVWGYFVSDVADLCPPGSDCTGSLSIILNVPTLSE